MASTSLFWRDWPVQLGTAYNRAMSGSPEERLLQHYTEKYAEERAEEVERVRLTDRPTNRFEATVAAILERPGGAYLEIGAGTGSVALTVMDQFDKLVLTELSPVRAEQMGRLFQPFPKTEVIAHNLDREELPYADGTFDTVAFVAVIEHLVEPISATQRLFRVTKPGGRVIIMTPNVAKLTRRVKLLRGEFPSTASLEEGWLCYDRKTPTDLHDEGHLHYFTYPSLERLCLERVGFSKVERRGFGKLGRTMPTLFSELLIIATK